MGLIETLIQALAVEYVYLSGILAISSILVFAALKGAGQSQIKVPKGNKMVNYGTVLVGAEEEETFSWLAEMKAKLRYMGEGHHLMFAAFKKVRFDSAFLTLLTSKQAFESNLEGAFGRLQILHPAAALHGGAEELAAHSHEFIGIRTGVSPGTVHDNEGAHDDGRSHLGCDSQPPDAKAGNAG